jgi:hypothetical protein
MTGPTMPRTAAVLILLILTVIAVASAREPLHPTRIEAAAPRIDGVLNDPVWNSAAFVDVFRTYTPDFGREVPQRTKTLMAYDADHLYFAFRCDDDHPELIKAAVTGRDNIRPDDWICINLDSFNDQQSLYAFYVNPHGIQMDSRYAANQEDFSVDLLWESGGTIDSAGYSIEIALPLKSLRYAGSDSVTMSVYFERRISRTSEQVAHPPMDPAKGFALVTQTVPMVYQGLKQSMLLEFIPAFTFSQRYEDRNGTLGLSDHLRDLSLTAKYGISSDLILDGTYNPDFSQVEADAGQVDVNLRYALFFPEKRPFFLEGSEIYTLAGTVTSDLDPVQSLVHTRTIVDPVAGVKLSGKLASRSTLAMLYAVDELDPSDPTTRGEHAIVPVLRFKQALQGDSYLGALYAARETDGAHGRVFGIDGMQRVTEGSTIEMHALGSSTRDPLRPDAGNGHALGLNYLYSTRDLDLQLTTKDIAEGFQADVGYITRTGVGMYSMLVRPRWYPDSSTVQRVSFELYSAQTRDHIAAMWETFNYAATMVAWGGTMQSYVRYTVSSEIFADQRFRTDGFFLYTGGQILRTLAASINASAGRGIYYSSDPYGGKRAGVTVQVTYQPTDNIEARGAFTYSTFVSDRDGSRVYEYPISRLRLTYQVNRYLFFRGVLEYNRYRRQMLTDFLASFTYVPGTVVHFGYGSVYEHREWQQDRYVESPNFHEMQRGFFFKMSYLWRV